MNNCIEHLNSIHQYSNIRRMKVINIDDIDDLFYKIKTRPFIKTDKQHDNNKSILEQCLFFVSTYLQGICTPQRSTRKRTVQKPARTLQPGRSGCKCGSRAGCIPNQITNHKPPQPARVPATGNRLSGNGPLRPREPCVGALDGHSAHVSKSR